MVQCCAAHPAEYRPWCLDRREPVKPGDPPCEDPNCDAHRHREEQLTSAHEPRLPGH